MHVFVPPHPTPIRELMDRVAEVPKDQVEDLILEFVEEIRKFTEPRDNDLYLRHLIVLGGLVSRAIFEVYEVPPGPGVVI